MNTSELAHPFVALPKRSGENTNLENTPESKRQRVSSDATVPGTHASSPANLSTVITQPQPPPHALPQTAQSTVAPRLTYHQILENVRQSEEQLRNLESSIRNATQMGNTELAQTLTQELNKKRESLMNFKKAISTYTQQMAARQQNQNQHQGSSPASAPSSSSPFNTTTTGNANLAHHHRSISGSQPQHPAVAVKPMSNQDSLLPTRMPMEQNKLSPHPAGSNAMGLNGSSNISTMQSEMMSGVASTSGQSQAVNLQTGAPTPQTVWKGLLKWSGQSQQGKKDMHTFVGANSQTPQRWYAFSLFSCFTILTLVYCKSSKYLASNACSIANISCSNANTPRLDESPCTRTLHVSPRHSSCPEI